MINCHVHLSPIDKLVLDKLGVASKLCVSLGMDNDIYEKHMYRIYEGSLTNLIVYKILAEMFSQFFKMS